MKKLGLIGGISWHTTVDYYKYINAAVASRLGGLNCAPCVIHSFNMEDLKAPMNAKDYDAVLQLFTEACLNMKESGVEGLVICANTMHMFAFRLEERTGLPVIHMVVATAHAIKRQGLKTVALLGTRPTMDLAFYKDMLANHGLNPMVPNEDDKDYIHDSIFEELSRGIFTEATKARYQSIIADLVSKGAEGVILGCTDIPPLIGQDDVTVPVFDTTRLHAEAAAVFCLGETQL